MLFRSLTNRSISIQKSFKTTKSILQPKKPTIFSHPSPHKSNSPPLFSPLQTLPRTLTLTTATTTLYTPLHYFSTQFPPSPSPQMSAPTTPTTPATHEVLIDETKYQEALENAYKLAKEKNQQLYIYITGAVNPETGLSWCPDCTATFGNLKRLKTAPGNYVLELPLERAKYRNYSQCQEGEGCKIEKHPYKTNPKLQLTAIPTLFKVNMDDFDRDYQKLVESECYDDDKFGKFTGL